MKELRLGRVRWLVRLVATWVSVANANQLAAASQFEAEHIASEGNDAALRIHKAGVRLLFSGDGPLERPGANKIQDEILIIIASAPLDCYGQIPPMPQRQLRGMN
ncbi:MAG: hypothetical protein ACYCSN_18125 [Acidobacteriaceae bacterium]